MEKESSTAHGLRWGLVIGLVYCILLFLRFYTGAKNPGIFSAFTFIGFAGVIVLLFLCGKSFRKKNGGALEMKEAFKTMFIAVLIFELFYAVFTVVYLRYIDPGFFEKFRLGMEEMLVAARQRQKDTDKALAYIDEWAAGARNLTVFDFLKTYLSNVSVTGLFALLFAFILKRKNPVFPDAINQA